MGTLMKNLAETSGENEPFQKCVFCARIASTKSKTVPLCDNHLKLAQAQTEELEKEYQELMNECIRNKSA
jgi:uncharacterized protein YigA (DUF484 family)